MNETPDFIVFRAHPDLPRNFLPPRIDGWWYDRADMPAVLDSVEQALAAGHGVAVAVPTGRFEVRDDGAVAEVWELRP